jgi:glycosyltransferase involved in cell wall biosynthesis
MHWSSECVAVIPCLNEEAAISSVVEGVRRHIPNVIVVDDKSSDLTAKLAAGAGAEVIRNESTHGKGAALTAGWRRAVERGFSWALVLDGDGQHNPEDIPVFFLAAAQGDVDLVVGNRMVNAAKMPWVRRQVNRWMSRRLSNAAGIYLPDSQCGFRLMKLASWSTLTLQAGHFEIESEMLLAFVAAGYSVKFVPIQVIYKGERSKIHPVRDTWRWFSWWHRAKQKRERHHS